jgi:hypothetical protein
MLPTVGFQDVPVEHCAAGTLQMRSPRRAFPALIERFFADSLLTTHSVDIVLHPRSSSSSACFTEWPALTCEHRQARLGVSDQICLARFAA